MDLSLAYPGRVVLPAQADGQPAAVLDRLAAALVGLSAGSVRRPPGAVTFRVGVFRWASAWNPLCPLTRGRIEAEPSGHGVALRYRLDFTEGVAVTTAFIGLAVALLARHAESPSPWGLAAISGVLWVWMVGANAVTAVARFESFLRRAGVSSAQSRVVDPGRS